MFTTVLIVFRESLEAALLVGVVAAATRGLVGRAPWLSFAEARILGQAVQQGQRPPWALLMVVAVLFVSGSLTSSSTSGGTLFSAVLLDIAFGATLGAVIFAGLTQVPTRHVFSVTNVLIALLAASLASQLVRAVAQAGLLQSWTTPIWDTSGILPQESAAGASMHALVGYEARPSAAQLTAYVLVLAVVYEGTRLLKSTAPPTKPAH